MPDSRPAVPRLPDKARFTENLCQQIEGFQRILQVPSETLAAALTLSPQEFQRRIIRVEDFTAYEIAVCAAIFRTTVSSLVGEEYPLNTSPSSSVL
ncbi:hypothetical protein [Adonisia turfae]|nr:hypothetical protein [Adonisia turfae]